MKLILHRGGGEWSVLEASQNLRSYNYHNFKFGEGWASNIIDSEISFMVQGTDVGFLYVSDYICGQAEVYVDDEKEVINSYGDYKTFSTIKYFIKETGEYGSHNLKIKLCDNNDNKLNYFQIKGVFGACF